MAYYIGIDLGTSSIKLLLMDEKGKIYNEVSREYPLSFPQPGWSEQNPEDWKNAVFKGIPQLMEGFDSARVAGIGVGGQMHGLVVLDKNDKVIRPAILWNDGRTAVETDYLNGTIGEKRIAEFTANMAFAGFTAPKILWLRENEPESFLRIRKIMLPKDYVNYILTGVHSCDFSDASGTLLLDVKNKKWSQEMLDVCGVSMDCLPELHESYEVIGTLLPDIAEKLGLPKTTRVCAGAGDNAAAAVGTGIVGDGGCNISLGTSGTIFISSRDFIDLSNHAIHNFAHADGGWHLMGCILSAASCYSWLMDRVYKSPDYTLEQVPIVDEMLGRNRVFFLPYLMGERSPINDVDARGTFIGLAMDTGRADITQAVMEGVAFAIRDCVEVAKSLGISIYRSRLCGGGARSELWRKILANVLNIELEIPRLEQGPSMGGAILAMVACGEYTTVQTAIAKLVRVENTIKPEPELVSRYEICYRNFKKIYPALKELYKEIR